MTHIDISDILSEWAYDPVQNVRRITTLDGTEKLQVRLPLGLEQYELDGRPDGARPEGFESYLDLYRHRLEEEVSQAELSHDDCTQLHEEGVLFYFRYYLCFQIGDFDRVMRDTRRNLDMFDFVDAHTPDEDDKARVDQHRPYVLRMMASATALKHAADEHFAKAVAVLDETVQRIQALEVVPTETFESEKKRSLSILEGMIKEMRERIPPSEREGVQERLKKAVVSEDYERAARLRDVLRRMDGGQ